MEGLRVGLMSQKGHSRRIEPAAIPATSAVPPKAEVNSEHYLLRHGPLRFDGIAVDMIQIPKRKLRIMRCEPNG
jgi:hypothetical protein